MEDVHMGDDQSFLKTDAITKIYTWGKQMEIQKKNIFI